MMRQRIATFARRETLQGQGLGRAEYRTGQPTERARRAIAEARAVGGAKATFRALLEEALPAEYAVPLPGEDQSRIEQAVALYEMYGTAAGVEAARTTYASLRPLEAAYYATRGVPKVEMALKDQPGFWAGIKEAIGYPERLIIERSVYDAMLTAFQRMEREGLPGGGRGGRTEVNMTITNNYQNAKFIGPDAASQHRRTTNGQNYTRLRRTG